MDDRILKNPLSGFDADKAKMYQYSDKKGYFGNFVDDFDDISQLEFGTLRIIKDGLFSWSGEEFYSFFLPEDYVSPEPSEKYRPYTLEEFRSKFPLLSSITFREKETGTVYTFCFLGYSVYKDNDYKFVTLGACEFRLSELFEEYEIEVDGEWLPFGVKEE